MQVRFRPARTGRLLQTLLARWNYAVPPDFSKLSALEEDVLAARLEAVRASISHGGEKGRALEFDVRQLLRGLLPPEYGLTTVFIAATSAAGAITLSSQLDIIIYDAIRHSPLIHLESWDVLPIEAVYGYVEVKASLTSTSDTAALPASNSIEACITANRELRRFNVRTFNITIEGSPMTIETRRERWLAPRGYVIAFEPDGAVAGDAECLPPEWRKC